MPITNGNELRQAFLDYFSQKQHPIVPSAPLVPPDDPTLLFTSAGMVQFKALYSGTVSPMPYTRAASVQKCLRAGGKGSDLENVGKTLRHHTFFEMLGNFSFGDYFKREAIQYAWEFCTSPEWMNLPKDRMIPTIYGTETEEDTEAGNFWSEVGCPNPPIPLDASENFWGPAGETGACGPCSEVKFFLGTDDELRAIKEDLKANGKDAITRLGRRVVEEGDLFLEIWNLVFPQFDQQRDGTRLPLKNKGVDTGAGLERMAVALRFARTGEQSTTYETDLLWPITSAVNSAVRGTPYPTVEWLQSHNTTELSALKSNFSSDEISKLDREIPGWDEAVNWESKYLDGPVAMADMMTALGKEAWSKLLGFHVQNRNLVRGRLAVNAIADHVRTLVFCLAEGLTPGNVGRRYVIRRIARRALRFASLLDMKEPFMADLYDSVVEAMGDAYPEIKKNPDFIKKSLRIEEETFLRTLDRGTKILDELISKANFDGTKTIPGEDIFKLWDTYGFPVDLTAEIAQDHKLSADLPGYEIAMKRQKTEAKKSWKGQKSEAEAGVLDAIHDEVGSTEFVGYSEHFLPTHIVGLIRVNGGRSMSGLVVPAKSPGNTSDQSKETKRRTATSGEAGSQPPGFGRDDQATHTLAPERVEILNPGEEGMIILDQTPFYAESGGQVGDSGVIFGESGAGHRECEFTVSDVQKTAEGLYIHRGKMTTGSLKVGQAVVAQIDFDRRKKIRRNHSSVHLLQGALKRIVGDHITQAGSFVGPDYARFDFTHTEPLTREQIAQAQREVNHLIINDRAVETEVLTLEEARSRGAIAPFGEKYGAIVRVVSMGAESVEFCGGTHAETTGELARFRIVAESSIAAGVRRVEVVTGESALDRDMDDQFGVVGPLQTMLAVKGPETLARVEALQNRVKDLEKELAKYKREAALKDVDAFAAKAVALGAAKLAIVRADGLESAELRVLATTLRDKLGETGVAVVASVLDDKISLVAAVGKAAQAQFPAGTVVNKLAAPLGGKGGGKPDMAQAGAKDVAKLDEVIAGAAELLG